MKQILDNLFALQPIWIALIFAGISALSALVCFLIIKRKRRKKHDKEALEILENKMILQVPKGKFCGGDYAEFAPTAIPRYDGFQPKPIQLADQADQPKPPVRRPINRPQTQEQQKDI